MQSTSLCTQGLWLMHVKSLWYWRLPNRYLPTCITLLIPYNSSEWFQLAWGYRTCFVVSEKYVTLGVLDSSSDTHSPRASWLGCLPSCEVSLTWTLWVTPFKVEFLYPGCILELPWSSGKYTLVRSTWDQLNHKSPGAGTQACLVLKFPQ